MKKLIVVIIVCCLIQNVFSQEWIPDPQKKYAMTYPVGSWGDRMLTINDSLFICGSFLRIGGVNARWIAKYNEGNWYPLKGGARYIMKLAYQNGNLFVAGGPASNSLDSPYVDVPGTDGICRWDGNLWHPVGANSSTQGGATIEWHDGKLFAAGNFNVVGTLVLNYNPAYFDGVNWHKAGYNSPSISSLKSNNTDLLGSGQPNNFYKYEGDTIWSQNPYGGCHYYWKMERDTINDFLYVAGYFYYICTNPPLISYDIAMWDQFQWHSMGTNTTSGVGAMQPYGGDLYAVILSDTMADGTQVNYIARWDWDTHQWYPLGSGLNNWVSDLEVFHDTLFVTGGFTIAGGDSAIGLARWYMPDTNCKYLRPMIHTLALQDTFNLWQGQAQVQFYNNNKYAQSWEWDFDDGSDTNTQNPVHIYTDSGTYNVSVTVTDNGCVKTAEKTIVVMVLSGEEEITPDKIDFNIYPNPTTGDVTAECNIPAGMTNAQIMVNDSFGYEKFKRDLKPGFNKFEIRSSIWPKGWYVAGVYAGNKQIVTKKFIKE
jgi:hypothetical protein